MGSQALKEIFETHLNIKKMVSLSDWSDYGGYFPLHSMKSGGLLGIHVDHSHSKSELLHMANSIFMFPHIGKILGVEKLYYVIVVVLE